MADYTLDAAAPQMVACCGAAGVVRGAAGGCSRETTVNGVADNRPMPGIELPACLPAHPRWTRKTDADAGSWRPRRSAERRVGKGVSVRVDLGGGRILKKKNRHEKNRTKQ